MAKKPTEKQLKVLQGMASGLVLRDFHGVNTTLGKTAVHGGTINGLRYKLLIRALPYKAGSFETIYELTAAGRAEVLAAPPADADTGAE